ncbi:MAG: hypothetical protein AB7I18_13405 [Candidatus Berkiella sp.]
MRQLNQNELTNISGGVESVNVYPTVMPGYEIVGWTQTIGMTSSGVMVDIQPIYLPIVTTTTTTTYYY